MATDLILTNGELLRKARRDAGLDQAELAREVGVRRETISAWETGRSEPTARQLKAIENATACAWLWSQLRRYLSPLDQPVCAGVDR